MINSKLSAKKPPRCKACKLPFEKLRPTQIVCGPECSIKHTQALKDKKERAEAKQVRASIKERKEKLKTRSDWLKEAKTELHGYIRDRDEGKSCISCDTVLLRLGRLGGDYDAGHFRSVGSAKHMEFVENNIHGQCKHCNDYLKGNPIGYERGLISRFGIEYVEALKNDNETRKLTVEDFKTMKAHYKQQRKILREFQA